MKHSLRMTVPLLSSLLLAACGGGYGSGNSGNGGYGAPTPAQRAQAAATTAQTNTQCNSISGYYWEVGDIDGLFASGTGGSGAKPAAGDSLLIASASKWLFGAYVVQLRNGNLLASDIKSLTMNSGYTNFNYSDCLKLSPAQQNAETVSQCFLAGNNSAYSAQYDGKYFYNGGHFQEAAVNAYGLGGLNNAGLQSAIAAQIGNVPFTYDSPQLAGGAQASAAGYRVFLQKILANQLKMHDALGSNAVCTNPNTCATAASTPIPSESWHYSLAHWVEDDPAVGDGAYSSPGAFGFYPWIDHNKTTYGILARYDPGSNAALESVRCGRLIRRAWLTATAQ